MFFFDKMSALATLPRGCRLAVILLSYFAAAAACSMPSFSRLRLYFSFVSRRP
jgi:hypothetical protein